MINYFFNTPTDGDRLFGVIGKLHLTKTFVKDIRLLVFASDKHEAMTNAVKFRKSLTFSADLKKFEDMERVVSEHAGDKTLSVHSRKFFDVLRTMADSSKNEPNYGKA